MNSSKLGAYCAKVLEMGWLLALIITPLFFNVYSSRVFEPDKLTTLRTVAVIMAAVWVVKTIEEWEPDIAFNLLEEFAGEAMDQNVVAWLELKQVPYSGCNPRGLIIARDKALSKKLLAYHRIRVPDFAVFPRGRKIRRPKRLQFPL